MTPGQLPEPAPSGQGSDQSSQPVQPDLPMTEGRDRSALAAELELNPQSLVGSYCHRLDNGLIKWQGIVVAEVRNGPEDTYFLVELTPTSVEGATAPVQIVTTLARMVAKDEGYEWRFYNTRDAMTSAFVDYELREVQTVDQEV